MSPAAFWEVVGGQDLISISRPQQQLLFTQVYARANSFCCDEQSRDGQGEAFAVGSLHSLGEEGDKSRTQFYLLQTGGMYSRVVGFIVHNLRVLADHISSYFDIFEILCATRSWAEVLAQ